MNIFEDHICAVSEKILAASYYFAYRKETIGKMSQINFHRIHVCNNLKSQIVYLRLNKQQCNILLMSMMVLAVT